MSLTVIQAMKPQVQWCKPLREGSAFINKRSGRPTNNKQAAKILAERTEDSASLFLNLIISKYSGREM